MLVLATWSLLSFKGYVLLSKAMSQPLLTNISLASHDIESYLKPTVKFMWTKCCFKPQND